MRYNLVEISIQVKTYHRQWGWVRAREMRGVSWVQESRIIPGSQKARRIFSQPSPFQTFKVFCVVWTFSQHSCWFDHSKLDFWITRVSARAVKADFARAQFAWNGFNKGNNLKKRKMWKTEILLFLFQYVLKFEIQKVIYCKI